MDKFNNILGKKVLRGSLFFHDKWPYFRQATTTYLPSSVSVSAAGGVLTTACTSGDLGSPPSQIRFQVDCNKNDNIYFIITTSPSYFSTAVPAFSPALPYNNSTPSIVKIVFSRTSIRCYNNAGVSVVYPFDSIWNSSGIFFVTFRKKENDLYEISFNDDYFYDLNFYMSYPSTSVDLKNQFFQLAYEIQYVSAPTTNANLTLVNKTV